MCTTCTDRGYFLHRMYMAYVKRRTLRSKKRKARKTKRIKGGASPSDPPAGKPTTDQTSVSGSANGNKPNNNDENSSNAVALENKPINEVIDKLTVIMETAPEESKKTFQDFIAFLMTMKK